MASTVDWSAKGVWLPEPTKVIGRHLFDGAFTWPAMVIRRSAVERNIATMAAFCSRHGVEHAPHGKTTMVPDLFRAQLAAGAWGITVATAHQALVARRLGVPRVLLANELLDPVPLRWAAQEVAAGWEFLYYVDSLDGLEVLAEALAGSKLRLSVLVEMGVAGGRTGCRTVEQATAVAAAAADLAGVSIAGVAGFEGFLPSGGEVVAFGESMLAAAEAVAPLCPAPLILSAGGSAYFDSIVDVLAPPAHSRGWRVILRSGSYVSHDDGLYAATTAFARRPAEGALTAALEVWAQVLSTPEPGLAIIGAGKRDVPVDEGMPIPLGVRERAGGYHDLSGAHIDRTNDQHAYLRGTEVRPGDLVKLGISHPCTAFDKWRIIPVLDDKDRVVDLYHTYF